MFRRPQVLKKFVSKTLNSTLHNISYKSLPLFPLSIYTKSLTNYQIPIYSFSSSSQNPSSLQSDFKEDLKDLDQSKYTQEQQDYMAYILAKYAAQKEDLSVFTQEELVWVSDALYFLSLAYNKANNYEKAYKYLQLENELLQKMGIKDTKEIAQNHFGSAICLQKGNPTEAEHHFKETIRICGLLEADKDTKDILLRSYCYLATIYMKTDKEKALEYHHLALEKVNEAKELGVEKLMMHIYEEMTQIYNSRNDLTKAADTCKKGLDFVIKNFGDKSREALNFSSDLAALYAKQGQYARAEQYAEESLKRATSLYQKNSPEVANAHSLLGGIHNGNEDFIAALESYDKAAKIYEKLKSDDLKNVHFHLAMIYHSLSDYEEAWRFLSKASSAYLKSQAEPSLDLAIIHYKLAKKLKEHKRESESRAHFEKALEMLKTVEPSQTTIISDIYGSMASMAYAQQDWNRALELFQESERYLDKNDSFTRRAFNTFLGSIYRNLKNYDESFKCLQEAIKSAQETGEISFVVSAYCELGQFYEEQGKWNEALEAYMNAKRYDEQDPLHTQTIHVKISNVKDKIKGAN